MYLYTYFKYRLISIYYLYWFSIPTWFKYKKHFIHFSHEITNIISAFETFENLQ